MTLTCMSGSGRRVTPPGGIVLDPVRGSGTPAIAAIREGFQWIGIEQGPEYIEIARARLKGEGVGRATSSKDLPQR